MTAVQPEQSTTTKGLLVGTGSQVGGRLVGAALSVVALRLTSSYLGPTRFGAFVSATALVTLLATLGDLGLVTTAARDVAAAPSPEAARHVIGVNLALRVTLAALLIPIAIALSAVMYRSVPDIRVAVGLLAPLLCVTAAQSCADAVLIGRGRAHLRAVTDVFAKALLLAGVVVVVHNDLGFRAYLAVSVVAAAIAAAFAFVVAARYIRPSLVFGLTPWRATLAVALPLGLVQALNIIYFKVDSLLLSLWRSPAEVGQYGVAYKVMELVLALPSFLMLTLLPALTLSSRPEAVALVRRAVRVLLAMAVPITVVGVASAPQVIGLIAAKAFSPATTPLRWLLVATPVSYVNAVYGYALVATGRQRDLLRLTVVVVAANIVVNAIVIPQAGASGAAFAVLLSESVSAVLVVRLFRRQFASADA